jgi:hypothetical protein
VAAINADISSTLWQSQLHLFSTSAAVCLHFSGMVALSGSKKFETLLLFCLRHWRLVLVCKLLEQVCA